MCLNIKKTCVISVCYKSSQLLNLNYNLICRNFIPNKWIVVKNHPNDNIDITKFEVIDGIPMPEDISCNVNKHSHHHALALNKALDHIPQNTDIILILDPDFFIFRPQADIIRHICDNGLSFFGAGYPHDGKKRPVRDFPVAFCMYIDIRKVDIQSLDFRPVPQHDNSIWYDTGHKVYERYSKDPSHKFEIVQYVDNKNGDRYFWQGKMFSIHLHAKLHLQYNDELTRLQQIRRYITND